MFVVSCSIVHFSRYSLLQCSLQTQNSNSKQSSKQKSFLCNFVFWAPQKAALFLRGVALRVAIKCVKQTSTRCSVAQTNRDKFARSGIATRISLVFEFAALFCRSIELEIEFDLQFRLATLATQLRSANSEQKRADVAMRLQKRARLTLR